MKKAQKEKMPQWIKLIEMIKQTAESAVNQHNMPYIKVLVDKQEKIIPMNSQKMCFRCI